MVDPIDDIFRQARQGSVAAVIQILNEKLADSGVRTRAVFAEGALQLLCEAATPEQLERTRLVPRVQRILEAISPRNVRKVHLHSRIVREQQLLWLEEIRRDPEGQLLWSELITLARPNPIKRLLEDRKFKRQRSFALPQTASKSAKSSNVSLLLRGILGGASLILLLLIVGWAVQHWLGLGWGDALWGDTSDSPEGESAETIAPTATDPFAQAVEIATQAAIDGTTAETPAEWLDLATRWQRASDLMAEVPDADPRYPLAQQRTDQYRNNSDLALRKAEQLRN